MAEYPYSAATSAAPAAGCFTFRNGQTAQGVLVFDRLSLVPPNGS